MTIKPTQITFLRNGIKALPLQLKSAGVDFVAIPLHYKKR